jgi:hypothetical protein
MEKLALTILILFLIISFSSETKRKNNFIDSLAFPSIITELFLTPQIPFDVIIYKSNSRKFFDIIDGIGSQLSGKILRISQAQNWTHELTQSAVIFTQNEKDLSEFLNKTELKNFVAKPLRFLIHSSEKIELEKLKIPSLNFDKGHIGHFSYFVIETLKEIQLKTFEWFTENFCHVQQIILINIFSKKNQKWLQTLKIDRKFQNFHNCTMKTHSNIYYYHTLEMLILFAGFLADNIAGPKYDAIKPFQMEIANIIGKRGNFLNEFSWDAHNFHHIFYLPRFPVLNDDCHVTAIISQDYETFALSPAESYGSYEKMMLTFDNATWICLLATMITALTSIFIINQLPEWIQDIFYGKGIRNASINFIGYFFGLGQTRLPENNFARILIATFLMFFMVLSTAYHGNLD